MVALFVAPFLQLPPPTRYEGGGRWETSSRELWFLLLEPHHSVPVVSLFPFVITTPQQHTPTNPTKHKTLQPNLLLCNILRILTLGTFLLLFGPLFPFGRFEFVSKLMMT